MPGLIIVAAALIGAFVATSGPASGREHRHPTPAAAPAREVAAGPGSAAPSSLRRSSAGSTASTRPNIVFVLTDDLSSNLVGYMPQVQALQRRGLTFDNYFVSDSLCCPSRSSIFTGNYPHDTGVYTNTGAVGGIRAFYAHHDERRTFNLALQRAGYRTAMMGKYLNGYLEGHGRSPIPPSEIPPGWNQWDVAGWGYNEFDYPMDENGTVHYYGHRPQDYLTGVLARKGERFIDSSAASGQPFFLELATFAPHTPYVPAPRDAHDFPGLTAPEPPSFDQMPTAAPDWLADHPPLHQHQIHRINRVFRRRVQDVQSVDRMIAGIETTLAADHELNNTYIVFSSDNGLHTGEYRLMPGKLTAFDTDIHVPLVVAGPGVPAGQSTNAMAENIDLAKTFAAIGGTRFECDGHSLMPLLDGATPPDWRNAILVEHHGPAIDRRDPDAQDHASGNPPSYEAIRSKQFLYVEYADGEREYYDLRTDPYELHNLAAELTPAQISVLHAELLALQNCHDGQSCWAASHIATAA